MKPSVLCFTSNPAQVIVDSSSSSDTAIFYAANREHAFQALANRSFDAVAADLPGDAQPGAEQEGDFLQAVMHRYPQPARILLFDPKKKKPTSTAGGVIHQCLTTPTSAEVIGSAALRARFVSRLLSEPGIKQLLPRLRKLPSVPAVYYRVLRLLELPHTDLRDLGNVVAEDLIMSAKLLQVVNSAYFALPSSVSAPAEAVGILGVNRFKAMVLAAHIFSAFQPEAGCNFSVEELWQHSLAVAQSARGIMLYETGDRALAEEAYTAGLLHDVGKFILAANCPTEYNHIAGTALARRMMFTTAEREIIGTTHAQIGAGILGTWGLPVDIIEAIAYHHEPLESPNQEFSVLTAVHAADALEHTREKPNGVLSMPWESYYLEGMGLEQRKEAWSDLMRPRQEAA